MRKVITTVLVLLLIVASVPAAAVDFEDAPEEDHWVYDNFITLYEIGLLQGYPDYTFRGEDEASRYELVELSARVLKNLQDRVEDLEGDLDGLNYLTPDQVEELIGDEVEEVEGEINELYAFIQELESEFIDDLEDQDLQVTTLAERVDGLEDEIDELADVQQEHDQRIEEALSTARQARLFGIIGILFGVAGIIAGAN